MSDHRTTGGRGFSFFLSLLASLYTALPVHAYTLTQTQNGRNIRWHYGQKFFLAGNPSNQSGLPAYALWTAAVNGLQQWKRASQGMFDFDYWQGTNPAIYKARQQQDGLNSIFFASQTNQKMDPNVIGFTQVWFNTHSGDLIEADIILNDRDYTLTDTPNDTSSHASAGEGGKRVYLNNVITHELGHSLGLSHSNSLNSTMLYVEFSEQFKLGCDDWSAVKHLYPTYNNGMGSLTGTILSPTSEPVPGAVITAISISRGIPIASVLTDQKGQFHFGALDAGNVSLMVEPYQGNPSSIPPRMRVRSNSVCENHDFPKNFITESDQHTLKKFHVTAGAQENLGAFRLSCANVSEMNIDPSLPSPETFVDHGEAGTSKTYTFQANGPFKITGLAYLLLSPIKVSLSLPDATGSILYRSSRSDFKIEDSMISGTAFGRVSVKVEISNNEKSSFPIPAVVPGASSDFVIIFNGNPSATPSSSIPNNARCESHEPYPDYQSPGGGPILDSTSTTTRENIGFCGNAHAASFHEKSETRQSTFPAFGTLLGWMFPFLAAIACQLFLRSRRSKLET